MTLLDLLMPGLDGVQAIARIRAVTRFKAIPVAVLTRKSDTTAVPDRVAAGARVFVVTALP